MTLIKSISGIRGTIGGIEGQGLTPIDIVKFTTAFALLCNEKSDSSKIVIGRDARISGQMASNLVASTLQSLGFDVVDLGLSTTPTVEIAVPIEEAAGGIILTASHNPAQWNALKLLNSEGEFISAEDGEKVLELAEKKDIEFAEIDKLGKYSQDDTYIDKHIQMILDLPLVDVEAITEKNLNVVIDCVNSTGGIAVPKLLKALGVRRITGFFTEPTGHFPHNPEPLPEHLTQISSKMKNGKFDVGIVVDPDVDRLALLNEDGTPFGEEYTLVAVADYVLKSSPGNTVSNLSSTRALKDITQKKGGSYNAAAVGEVNVVNKMKDTNAIIGGEGNGGVIYPKLHYGRDALVGIALFLSHLAKSDKTVSELRAQYPNYQISKNKIELTPEIDVDGILKAIEEKYKNNPINTIDGVKIEFENEWVHLRKSNTEPIIRIYSESETLATAEHLANRIISDIKEFVSNNKVA